MKNTAMSTLRRQAGLSLIELLIAIAISLFLIAGLMAVFAASNRSYVELNRSAVQIENGRYAMQVLTDNLAQAGHYGRFSLQLPIPGALPDPCDLAPAALRAATAFPVQGYDAPASSPITTCLPAANHVPGTDILVLRRADSTVAAGGAATIPAGALDAQDVYLQANADPNNSANPIVTVATGTPDAVFTLRNKDGTTLAPIRKFHVHVYFVAPCSVPAGGGSVCTGANDDGGSPIPTLKRLELLASGGVLAMQVVPIAEGIENFQVDYGVDASGDGVPDGGYVTAPAAVADWANIVSVRAHVLARNLEPSGGFVDAKIYDMGAGGTVEPGGPFKRHVYNATVRVVNPAGRRET
jgi:type IV pilus assembly protein PilW